MNEAQAIKRAEAALICADGVPWVTIPSEVILALLSANQEMRKALEFYADEPAREFPSDGPWGVNSDDFGRVARSALTTQRGE